MNSSAVLVIDDSQVALNQCRDILVDSSLFKKVYLAESAEQGLALAASRHLDMILCDVCMPGLDGFNFLALRNEKEQLRDVPVIMITMDDHPESKVRGLDLGASDYITKPFYPDELLARIRVHLKLRNLQDQLKRQSKAIAEQAKTDPLTGLCNRRGGRELLRREFFRSSRRGSSLSVLLADLDRFQSINETYGHAQGDRVLAAVAEWLQRNLRPYDLVVRFSGESFLLVLPETTLSQGCLVAERLRSNLSNLSLPRPLENLALAISLGVAAAPDQRIQTIEDLLREAETALFRAKRDGRNRVHAMHQ